LTDSHPMMAMEKRWFPKNSHIRGLLFGLVVAFFAAGSVHAQDLSLSGNDLRIEQGADGGYHLYIRAKPDIASVLLTESTRDPTGQADNYAYRSPEWNAVTSDEPRVLNGTFLPKETGSWSLIDSSPETHGDLGQAFHIWIPYVVQYGYPWTRNGEVYVVDGTYLNIRAFERPYGDYRGSFKDNPFILKVTQKPLPGPPEGNYMKAAEDAFREIAASGKGELVKSSGTDDVVPKIKALLDRAKGKSVDLVLALDTTSSMKDDIDSVRGMLIPMLEETIAEFTSFRIGMVLYKDYFDEYITRIKPFTTDFGTFQKDLNAIRVAGGRDIPEAVHEALYAAATEYPWAAEKRMVILIGDAPPHPRPRGKITKRMVDEAAEKNDLEMNVIILPQ